jgi:hypothetical protein
VLAHRLDGLRGSRCQFPRTTDGAESNTHIVGDTAAAESRELSPHVDLGGTSLSHVSFRPVDLPINESNEAAMQKYSKNRPSLARAVVDSHDSLGRGRIS